MKKKLTDKDILNAIEHMSLRAQKKWHYTPQQQTLVDKLLQDVSKRCTTERQQYAARINTRHLAVRTLSLTVTAFCLLLMLYSDPRCGFVVDGKLVEHFETIDNIDNLF